MPHEHLQHWVDGGFPSVSVVLATSCGIVWTGAAGDAQPASDRRASTSDLAEFADALRDGGLLKPESVRFMMTWRATDQPGTAGTKSDYRA